MQADKDVRMARRRRLTEQYQFTVRLPAYQYYKMRTIAKALDCSLASFCEPVLSDYLDTFDVVPDEDIINEIAKNKLEAKRMFSEVFARSLCQPKNDKRTRVRKAKKIDPRAWLQSTDSYQYGQCGVVWKSKT